MRLIDADALIPTEVHTIVVLKDGREQLESVLYAEQVDNAPTVEPASPWHRVEDELPEKEGDYLVWTMLYGGHAYTDYYTPKYGWDEYKVIAWMPLPEPPKEDA